EIEGLREMLYTALQAYSSEVSGTPLVYDSASYPYFFIDSNADGEVGDDEAAFPNRYNAWTPRLAKAAYNYQVSLKDPGRYAHGGKYIIQLLYDSIESLNEAIATPVDLSNANRIDRGHFAGSEEAFRHWDEDGAVPGSCSRCHSAEGLPLYITEGVAIEQPTANGLNCTTCHNDLSTWTRYESESVAFPSGATLSLVEVDDKNGLDANLCLNCHQGRESTVSVNRVIGNLGDDDVSESLRFRNIHYFAAGASLFGTEAQGGYEYEGQTYAGRNEHVNRFDVCTECHSTHALEVKVDKCGDCHDGVTSEEDLTSIRVSEIDFDGDGDVSVGIALEVENMRDALYDAMQAYASDVVGAPLVYDSQSYPYFFLDTNADGVPTPDEANYGNQYNAWTPALLRAAYNYQYAQKDPGGFAHNNPYILQLLYDSLAAMGGDVSGMTRPEVPAG
ncbi:MAG: cytochrome c3 family protein, partial [Anaerolineales bacterium]